MREIKKKGRKEENNLLQYMLESILLLLLFFPTKIFSGAVKEVDIMVLDLIFGEKRGYNHCDI